jgi:hypothetical protein
LEQRASRLIGGVSFPEQTMQIPGVMWPNRNGEDDTRDWWLLLEDMLRCLPRGRSTIRDDRSGTNHPNSLVLHQRQIAASLSQSFPA